MPLQAPGGVALPPIEAAFPGVVKNGVLDRQALGARVFGNKEALRRLEAIVHPLVGQRQRAFLKRAALRGEQLVVLDIPLLFEGLGERRVDATLVVSAPAFLQRHRVMARPGMTAEQARRHPAPAGARRAEAAQGKTSSSRPGWASRRRGRRSPRRSPGSKPGAAASGRPIRGARNSQASLRAPSQVARSRLQGRMREIVLDTETTGLDPLAGHRVVEIGCIELINTVATGQTFQAYFNPEHDMPTGRAGHSRPDRRIPGRQAAVRRQVDELLAFIGDAQLVIHNAQFDLGFLNAELERAGRPKSPTPISTPCRWRAASSPASAPASMRCASASASTIPAAPSTARCSIRSCWPRSISS